MSIVACLASITVYMGSVVAYHGSAGSAGIPVILTENVIGAIIFAKSK